MTLRTRLALLLLSTIMGCALPSAQGAANEGLLAGKVLRVVDGDTLDVLLSSGRIRVRLQGVDAPEHDQPGGREAQQWLRELLMDKAVLLEPISQDRYERLLALVHIGDVDVNRELVRSGNAWAYRRYLRAEERLYCDIEAAARQERRGLWKTPLPHAPWEHRNTGGRGPFTDFSQATAGDCHQDARLRSR